MVQPNRHGRRATRTQAILCGSDVGRRSFLVQHVSLHFPLTLDLVWKGNVTPSSTLKVLELEPSMARNRRQQRPLDQPFYPSLKICAIR